MDAHLPSQRFDRAVWIDYDHDYDLDLILLGAHAGALCAIRARPDSPIAPADFPFVQGRRHRRLQSCASVPDSKAFDLAVFYRDHAPVLYRDQLGGRYAAEPFQGHAAGRRRTSRCRFR